MPQSENLLKQKHWVM